MDPTKVMVELVSALGPMGFVFWLVWRTTSHTIPRLAQSFEEAVEKQRQDFKELLLKFQEHEQKVHQGEVDRLCRSIDALADKMVTPEAAMKHMVEALVELKRVTNNGSE